MRDERDAVLNRAFRRWVNVQHDVRRALPRGYESRRWRSKDYDDTEDSRYSDSLNERKASHGKLLRKLISFIRTLL